MVNLGEAYRKDEQKTNKRRTKDEQKTVRAARSDGEKTKKTSPLHIPSFRWLPRRGGMWRREKEEMTSDK